MESHYTAGPVTLHPTFRTNVASVSVDVGPGAKLMATATGVVSFTGPVAFDTVKCYLYLGASMASPAYAAEHLSAASPGPASLALTGSWAIPNIEVPPVTVSFECQSLEFTDMRIENVMLNISDGPWSRSMLVHRGSRFSPVLPPDLPPFDAAVTLGLALFLQRSFGSRTHGFRL